MRSFFNPSYISAGVVALLIAYTGSAAIVYQAGLAAGLDETGISSWLWALGLGVGGMTLIMSLIYRIPVMIAWSTPGAALLVTALSGVPMDQAVGAFIVCSVLLAVCGLTGWFDKLMRYVPSSLAAALLAGVLLQFALQIFPAFTEDTGLVGAMLAVYLLGRWQGSRYAVAFSFLIGVIWAAVSGESDLSAVTLAFTQPIWVMPSFDLTVILGVGLPLFIVTMASQNVPGMAAMRAHGYHISASPLLSVTGIVGVVLAPFGGFAFNLAAIMASLAMSPDVDPDPKRRYLAAVWVGMFFILAGLFGGTVASFFAAFPTALVAAIGGIALLGTIASSLTAALEPDDGREAALLTFVITASSGSFLTIGAPFWGLLVGLALYHLLKRKANWVALAK